MTNRRLISLTFMIALLLAGCSQADLETSSGTLRTITTAPDEPAIATPAPTPISSEIAVPTAVPYVIDDDPELSPGLEQRSQGTPVLRVVEPDMGATVSSPVLVRVEVDRFQLAAKGISRDGAGHVHVLVNEPCVSAGEVILDDHQHIGNGASEFTIDLEPGDHTLCLQIGDGFHSALNIVSVLEIKVVEG